MGYVYSRYVLSEKILQCTLGLEQEKDVESPPRPYLLQLSHPPHQPGGDGMQLQEIQAVQRPFQHVDDGGELWDKGRVSPGRRQGPPWEATSQGLSKWENLREQVKLFTPLIKSVPCMHVRLPHWTVSSLKAAPTSYPFCQHSTCSQHVVSQCSAKWLVSFNARRKCF